MNNLILKIKQQIVLVICCFSFITVVAQPKELSPNAEISVLTCGIGDEMYTLFGHTALRVKDVDQNLDVVYNWGMFDFNTPNFLGKFVKGSLLYHLGVDRYDQFIYSYTATNRTVISQVLNLDHSQKMIIWNEINRQLHSNERYYVYGFIQNNCTTKVVDILNKAYSDSLEVHFEANNHSYRYILNEGLTDNYFEKLGINLLFGYATNSKTDLIFLPIKLQQALESDQTKILAQKQENVVNSIKSSKLNSIYSLWFVVVLISLFSTIKVAQKIYFTIVSLFSFFLLTVSFFTNHPELHFNVLILFFNFITLVGILCKNKKIIYAGNFISCISLFFIGFELLNVVFPLVFLHLVYNLMLLLPTKTKS